MNNPQLIGISPFKNNFQLLSRLFLWSLWITALQGWKGSEKSSRTTAHVMPVAPGMSILVEYLGVVRLHISTNITSPLIFHSKHFSQWESSLRLSHNMCFSNFHPLVEPFGPQRQVYLFFYRTSLEKAESSLCTFHHLSPLNAPQFGQMSPVLKFRTGSGFLPKELLLESTLNFCPNYAAYPNQHNFLYSFIHQTL